MSCERCEAINKKGEQCNRLASCRLGCSAVCWQHADKRKSPGTCSDRTKRSPRVKSPARKPSPPRSQRTPRQPSQPKVPTPLAPIPPIVQPLLPRQPSPPKAQPVPRQPSPPPKVPPQPVPRQPSPPKAQPLPPRQPSPPRAQPVPRQPSPPKVPTPRQPSPAFYTPPSTPQKVQTPPAPAPNAPPLTPPLPTPKIQPTAPPLSPGKEEDTEFDLFQILLPLYDYPEYDKQGKIARLADIERLKALDAIKTLPEVNAKTFNSYVSIFIAYIASRSGACVIKPRYNGSIPPGQNFSCFDPNGTCVGVKVDLNGPFEVNVPKVLFEQMTACESNWILFDGYVFDTTDERNNRSLQLYVNTNTSVVRLFKPTNEPDEVKILKAIVRKINESLPSGVTRATLSNYPDRCQYPQDVDLSDEFTMEGVALNTRKAWCTFWSLWYLEKRLFDPNISDKFLYEKRNYFIRRIGVDTINQWMKAFMDQLRRTDTLIMLLSFNNLDELISSPNVFFSYSFLFRNWIPLLNTINDMVDDERRVTSEIYQQGVR